MTPAAITHPERTSRRILIIIATGILAVALLFSGFYVGYKRGIVAGTDVIVTGVINGERTVPNADFDLFWEAWQKLRDYHIDSTNFSNQDLVYGAISGLTGSFNDPHTNFFPPLEAKKFQQDVNGNFGGIGAEIGIDSNQTLSVISPLKDSPAERAGMLAGDLILEVDGRSTAGMSVDEAVSYIRGTIGTTVVLQTYRTGWKQPRDVSIVRENIKVPTLDVSFKDDDKIAYIQFYSFNENAISAFTQATQEISRKGARGIILDLRNNPGGYLEVANEVAGFFVKQGSTIVSERFKDGTSEPFISRGSGVFKDLPLVVLINGGSASASEILAGALRDLRGVKLVGEKSYGKGTVQEIKSLSDTSSIKITIARWVMPAGGILDKIGLEPDYLVKPTDEDIEAQKDVQFEKALEVLKAQL
ncbi:MAG: S41 family peptidase [bacterium]|nr:S41 family peptidase [bacterium]